MSFWNDGNAIIVYNLWEGKFGIALINRLLS
jgi:hypothetical protein